MATAGSAAAAAIVISLLLPGTYESIETFTIMPEGRNSPMFSSADGSPQSNQIAPLVTQEIEKWYVATLESEAIRTRVAKIAGLNSADNLGLIDIEGTRKHVFRVKVRDRDAKRAALIAGAYPSALNQFSHDLEMRRNEQSVQLLNTSLTNLENQIQQARSRLLDFLNESNTSDILKEFDRLADRKTQLQVAARQNQTKLDALDQRIATMIEQMIAEAREFKGDSGVLSSPVLQRLLKEIGDTEADLASTKAEFDGPLGEQYPKVKALRARLEQQHQEFTKQSELLDKSTVKGNDSYYEQMRRQVLALRQERDSTRSEAKSVNDDLSKVSNQIQAWQPRRMRELDLNSELGRLDRMRENLLLKLRETQSRILLQPDIAVHLSPAEVPKEAKFPQPVLSAIIATLLGAVFGMYLVFFREYLLSARQLTQSRASHPSVA
jgi:uncharacterized protein involved in exopolysaccharide biosynthesis